MGTSILIARVLGPCFLAVATGIMLNLKFYQKMMEDYAKSPALIYLGGVASLVVGTLVLLAPAAWVIGWPLFIKVFLGLGGVIKGLWLIIFPKSVGPFLQRYSRQKNVLLAHAVLAFALGTAMTLWGY